MSWSNLDQERLKLAISALYGVSNIRVEANPLKREDYLTFENDEDAANFIQHILPAIEAALRTATPNTPTYSELQAQKETLPVLKQADAPLIKTPSINPSLYPSPSPLYSPAPSSSALPAPSNPTPLPVPTHTPPSPYRVVMSEEKPC